MTDGLPVPQPTGPRHREARRAPTGDPARKALSRRTALRLGVAGAVSLAAACTARTPSSRTPDRTPDRTPGPGTAARPSPSPPAQPSPSAPQPGWRTVFEDTFDRGLDPAIWTPADYGGNRDLSEQHYNDPSRVEVRDRKLVLHATRGGRDGYAFAAGGVSSKDKVTVGPYGRLTTRQFLGPGHGLGVGVCLYGANIDAVGWPACGEIDATEIALARPEAPFGSVHGPGYSGGSPISGTRAGNSLVGRWADHVLTWEPGRITWAIDGEVYHVAEATDPRAAQGWPFDQPFFLTLVMTVGSHASGPVDLSTWPRDERGAEVDPYAIFDFVRFEQWAEEEGVQA